MGIVAELGCPLLQLLVRRHSRTNDLLNAAGLQLVCLRLRGQMALGTGELLHGYGSNEVRGQGRGQGLAGTFVPGEHPHRLEVVWKSVSLTHFAHVRHTEYGDQLTLQRPNASQIDHNKLN